MTKISVYDTTANTLDELSEENYTTIAEIIDALITAVKDGDIELTDYI